MIRFLLALGITVTALSAREFTDDQGRKVEAEVAGFSGDRVKLRLTSGKITTFPIARLSPADREFLSKHPARSIAPVEIDPNARHPATDAEGNGIYIDLKGKKVFDAPRANTPTPLFDGKTLLFDLGGIYNGYFDQDGNLLLSSKDLGVRSFEGPMHDDLIRCFDGSLKKRGFVDHSGKEVIPFRYLATQPMRDGVAWVAASAGTLAGEGTGLNWELINIKGETLIKLPMGYEPSPFSNGFSKVVPNDKERPKAIFFDTSGKQAFIDKDLPAVRSSFMDGRAFVGGGLIDTGGHWVIPPDGEWHLGPSRRKIIDGLVLATRKNDPDSSFHLVSAIDGKRVTTLPKSHDCRLVGAGLVALRSSEPPLLWALFDRLGNQITPFKFDSISEFHEDSEGSPSAEATQRTHHRPERPHTLRKALLIPSIGIGIGTQARIPAPMT